MAFETESDRDVLKTTSLDEFLVENREATFMLRMRGSAMAHAGILDGDFVLVERGAEASERDVVAAVEDGRFVIRRVRDLESRDTARPSGTITVEGVVRAVVRKY